VIRNAMMTTNFPLQVLIGCPLLLSELHCRLTLRFICGVLSGEEKRRAVYFSRLLVAQKGSFIIVQFLNQHYWLLPFQ